MIKRLKIKLMFILMAFTCFVGNVSSQTILSENNIWNMSSTSWIGGESINSYSYRIGAMVQFNDKSYFSLDKSSDSLALEWTETGKYLREDELSKVYLLENEIESILYDFSLEINETINLDSECQLVVVSTDSIELTNGEFRKRLYLKLTDQTNYPTLEWIEGVGSQFGLIEHKFALCFTDANVKLLCFKSNAEILYPENPESCFITVTNRKNYPFLVPKYQISQNPIEDFFSINLNEGERLSSIEIYSIDGDLIYIKNNYQNGEEINLHNFMPGTYILKIDFNEVISVTEKIIKI